MYIDSYYNAQFSGEAFLAIWSYAEKALIMPRAPGRLRLRTYWRLL
jgi:hypothetical protein